MGIKKNDFPPSISIFKVPAGTIPKYSFMFAHNHILSCKMSQLGTVGCVDTVAFNDAEYENAFDGVNDGLMTKLVHLLDSTRAECWLRGVGPNVWCRNKRWDVLFL